ncbi:apoptosis regulator BAX-like [Limanda limanda]|uniref:apoptosis regulator BAX-like n=1 Tax=Limanda limanda TaxID=27771 RepID=UPI0029C806D8|nr:apoptosis regulator BAX-like [Limanda limanda]XP_060942289.1 apoptosis regulator BAX-like [Limanda limanda]XP_060942290.1 apoptosis regulator BAX-like [Limanda limanda]
MACGDKDSDERIAKALLKKVVKEDLIDIPLEDVSFLTLDAVEVQNEEEEELVKKGFTVVCEIGEKLQDDEEIQDDIKGLVQNFNNGIAKAKEIFQENLNVMFQGGITWEKIVRLLYFVGKVAYTMVKSKGMAQSLMELLIWILDFFLKDLLLWIRGHGGWIGFESAVV